ncbi:hypothetical protein, partial [Fodinibius salsisoli]
MLLAIDVSSRRLDLYSRYRQDGHEYEITESFSNEVTAIAARLDDYSKQAQKLGYTGLSFVVEPSGRYEATLTQTALDRGHSVWRVNPERMYKAGVIHHGDGGKSDPLDGRVLYMLGRMGKARRLVPLPAEWQRLRELGKWLEDCTLIAADLRIRIGTLRRSLFTDYHQSTDLSWGATGRALQECYGFDPRKVTAGSQARFIARMKAHRPGLPKRCLMSIWEQAQHSCKAALPADHCRMVSDQLSHLWRVWSDHTRRKRQLEQQMIAVVDGLDPEHWIPPLFPGFNKRMRAKILGETGPLRR